MKSYGSKKPASPSAKKSDQPKGHLSAQAKDTPGGPASKPKKRPGANGWK